MNADKCSTKGCKGEVEILLLGKPLCEKCWEKHCKSGFDDEEIFDEVKGSTQKTLLSVINKKQLDPWDMEEVFNNEGDEKNDE